MSPRKKKAHVTLGAICPTGANGHGRTTRTNMPKELQRMQEISRAIADGKPTDLTCPYCGAPNLVFSFTVMQPPLYGLFIECKNCKTRQHTTLNGKPKNFREELVLEEYQRIEDQVWRRVRQELDRLEAEGRLEDKSEGG